MNAHPLAVTTHTLELDQLAEINDHLPHARPVTAAELLVDGLRLLPPLAAGVPRPAGRPVLPAFAVLHRVEASGPPEYPTSAATSAASRGAPATSSSSCTPRP